MSDYEFTSEQILQGISAAIAERNFDAAIAMARLLAVQDPHAAQSVVDVVTLVDAAHAIRAAVRRDGAGT